MKKTKYVEDHDLIKGNYIDQVSGAEILKNFQKNLKKCRKGELCTENGTYVVV